MTTDESGPAPDAQNSDSQTAVADSEAYRMSMEVDVQDSGPCRKHIRVKVPQADIDHFRTTALDEFCVNANVPGFRVGHVPRKLVARKFRKEVTEQVKHKVLLESLEQLSEENDFDPIDEPNIDVDNIEIPEAGDFEYEFDVEVRPEFDVPDYKGLQIERPTREITDEDIASYRDRFLSQYGRLTTHDGPAEKNDHITTTVTVSNDGEHVQTLENLTLLLRPVLAFQDAELEGFDDLMTGVEAGGTREAEATVSQEAESIEMRGEKLKARFDVHEVKRSELPEMNKEFLDRLGVESEAEFDDEIRGILDRQVTYEQRQSTRRQVLDKITESANWELPEDLVLKQVENALRREILEMQQAGFTTQQIQARENELRQQAVSSTERALKEHFVLDKIATTAGIEVEPSDIETEIRLMAMQRGESPRRVRARLTKSGMIENLEAQIRERKAVDLILGEAKFKDVPMPEETEDRVEAIPRSICGLGSQSETAEEADEEAED